MSDIKSLILACEPATASSSKINVCSIVFVGLSVVGFCNGGGSSLETLLSMPGFSGQKFLAMSSLPAYHHSIISDYRINERISPTNPRNSRNCTLEGKGSAATKLTKVTHAKEN